MATDLANALTVTLKNQAIPIIGVSVGDPADRSTWRIDFDKTATAQQRSDAAATLAAFDVTAPSVQAAVLDTQAVLAVQPQIVKAILAALLDQKLGRTLTAADAPALQALFTKTVSYYKFIVANGL